MAVVNHGKVRYFKPKQAAYYRTKDELKNFWKKRQPHHPEGEGKDV